MDPQPSTSQLVNISGTSDCKFNKQLCEKQLLKDALVQSERCLRSENLITDEASIVVSDLAITVGEKIAENIMGMLNEYEVVTEECLIDNDE